MKYFSTSKLKLNTRNDLLDSHALIMPSFVWIMFLLCICHIMQANIIPCEYPYLALCTIAKDELDVSEWIEYHRRMGVAKFYLFDHGSASPILDSILSYVKSGVVEYRYLVGEHYLPNPQIWVYNRCLYEFGAKHQFMAFMDADEYIVVRDKTKKIPDVLREFEDFGGLTLNWRIMGMSGHLSRPEGGILQNYNTCGKDYHVKTIVNTEKVAHAGDSPHYFFYRDGAFATDTTKRTRVVGSYNPGLHTLPHDELYEVMYVNHYFSKSMEDFQRKMGRGVADRVNDDRAPKKDWQMLADFEAIAGDVCEHLKMPSEEASFYCWRYLDCSGSPCTE